MSRPTPCEVRIYYTHFKEQVTQMPALLGFQAGFVQPYRQVGGEACRGQQ